MRKLFTLLTVALVSTSMWAQFDDSPELKPASKVVIDGKSEYILSINVEGETYFYGKGNAWGTRTSVKENQEDALTVRFYEGVKVINGDSVVCLTFNNYVSDKSGWGAKVDVDDGDHLKANNGNQSWVDGQGRRGDGYWQLTNLGNGQIELQNLLVPGSKFGVSLSVADWNNDEQAYVPLVSDEGGSWDNRCYHIGAAAGKIAVLDDEGEATGDTIDAYIWGDQNYTVWQAYDAGVYNAKLKLYNWYWDGGYEYIDNGVTIVADAIKAADEVYNKDGVTAEELEAAYDAIMTAIGMVQVEENKELLSGATDTDPIELFEYGIGINGDFESENVDGWTRGMAHQNGGQYQGASYSNGSVKIQKFAESWTGSAQHSSNGKFYQNIALPAGLYTLEADMIATRQSGSKADSKGVYLYATSADEDFSVEAATGNNAPEHFSVSFVTKGGLFEIGVRAVSTTCNWIAMDNFKLYYYGDTDKPLEQINLGKTIAGLETRYNNHVEAGDLKARTVILDTYDALYEVVLAAYENGGLEDPSEYTVLGDSLTKAYNALSSSIQDYKQFAKNMEAVQDRIAEQEEMNADCAAELGDYYDVLAEEYEKGEWTREQIDEIPGVVSDILGKYADVKPGDDVTFYLNNAKFEKDFSGWNLNGQATPGYSKNHGQGENANADLCQEAPLEDDGLAECFHALFNMSQTIKNLPAGLYTLSVQGFNRHDDGNNESAQLYAKFSDGSEQTQDFASIDDYKTEDRLYLKLNADGNAEWMSDAGRDGDSYWVPNGMTGAAWHFMNKKDGENYDYTNKFQILMKEAGDLTVGVRVTNTHQWVIWDNFTLVYEGSGPIVWIQPLEDEIAKLVNKYEEAGTTSGEKDAIDEVIDEAQALIKAITDATEEDCQAMLLKLQAQHNEIAKNTQLTKTIDGYYDAVYAETVQADLEDKDDAELQKRYDAICDLVDGAYDELNNTELEAAIEEIKAVLGLIKMPKGWENASDENPVDFSKVIANRFFNVDGSEDPEYEPEAVQNHNFTEWQGKQFGTGGGQQANCGEVWNSGAFDAYQELTGLPEGTYILACQGFLRHSGGTADSYAILNGEKEQTVYTYLYGNSSEGKYSTELCNITEVQLTQEELDSLGIDIAPGNSTFGDVFKGADQLRTADNFFKAGYYNNSIVVKVGADGILRIGIQKIGAVGQDWVVVDNFSLTYLGNNSATDPSDDPKTAIDAVETLAQKGIYTITGVRTSKVNKPGLYIINGKKVLVK